MPGNVNNKGPIQNLFNRMDRNGDQGVSRKEVVSHLKDADVPAGLFGAVHKKVSSEFVDNLDTNRDKKVTWDEFQGVASELLPEAALDADGLVDRGRLNEEFGRLDKDADGQVSYGELERGTLERLPESASFKGTIAEVAAKLGIDALDSNTDGQISLDEMEAVAGEVDLIADHRQSDNDRNS
jgi:Ca2+-binding EF-hand superfamily protein